MSRWLTMVLAVVLLLAACAPAPTGSVPTEPAPTHSQLSPLATVDETSAPSPPSPTATEEPTPSVQAAAPSPVTVAAADDALVGDALWLADGLVVVGSLDGVPTAWTSTDGETWQAQGAGMLGEAGHLTEASAFGGLVVAVGWRSVRVGGGMTNEPLVVAGRLGGPWRPVTGLPLPPNVRVQLTGVAADGRRVVVGGVLSDGRLASWVTTDDGVTWTGPNAIPSEPGSSIAAMTFAEGEFISVGESIGMTSGPAVWRSPDGASWSADHPQVAGGSLADVASTEGGPVAVGHDGEGHATVWALRHTPPVAIEPPDVDDLYGVTGIGDSILVAAPNAASTPLLFLTESGWTPLRLTGAGSSTLRAVAASGQGFLVAGDDGSSVLAWRGSLD